MPHFRGFIAIELDASSALIQFQQELVQSGAHIKLVEPHNIHLTLKFLGDTDESLIDPITTILTDAAKTTAPFQLSLQGTGVFPNEKYIRVIWIGMTATDIITPLAKYIDTHLSTLGFKLEARAFSPHLTVARVKSAQNIDQLLSVVHQHHSDHFASQQITALSLKKSDLTPTGPIYTTLSEIPLN